MQWTFDKRLENLGRLGKQLRDWFPEKPSGGIPGTLPGELQEVIRRSSQINPWFTNYYICLALYTWGQTLTLDALNAWRGAYTLPERTGERRVVLIMAGNIPLVGMHDALAVFLSGQQALCKWSSQDPELIRFLFDRLNPEKDPSFPMISPVWPLQDMDAVIATGSGNTNRYFEHYFGDYPHIFRANRTSVAVLDGKESEEELSGLIDDMFLYFGLGCRNVSKLFLPEDHDLRPIMDAIAERRELNEHHKFGNNYHYQKAVLTMNAREYRDTGNALMIENPSYHAPVSTIHYEFYTSTDRISGMLDADSSQLQCKVRRRGSEDWITPGSTQQPGLMDYSDGVDTMDFLLRL